MTIFFFSPAPLARRRRPCARRQPCPAGSRRKPVLRPLTDPAALAQDPFVFGSPILLRQTAPGRRLFLRGERFSLPVNEPAHGCHLHGFVHRQRFSVECRQEDAVTLSYENRGEIYPSRSG